MFHPVCGSSRTDGFRYVKTKAERSMCGTSVGSARAVSRHIIFPSEHFGLNGDDLLLRSMMQSSSMSIYCLPAFDNEPVYVR